MREPEKTPSMKEREDNSGGNPHRAALIIALVLIGLIAVAGWGAFLFFWNKGDEKAEVFSGLLAFLAAISSSIVTVIFIYLTSASLQKAQAGIDLQREELEQIKSSVDLQRKEWEQKVRVVPKFWVTNEDTRVWYKKNLEKHTVGRVLGLQISGEFSLKIWNSSEQSFLVDGLWIERLDFCGLPVERVDYLQLVLAPQSVRDVDVSMSVMRLLTHTPVDYVPLGHMVGEADKKARIGFTLRFSDWSQSQVETEPQAFLVSYESTATPVTIRAVKFERTGLQNP